MRWYETTLNKGFHLNRNDVNKEKTPYFLSLDSNQTDQNVLGFGGAFTEAAAYNFSKMSKPQQDKIIDLYFHPDHGLGYTLGRMAMNSCDFALGNYTYVEENDETLESFSIERERRWVIPMIHRANQVTQSPVQILVSPWSPPAWMKTNQQMNHGGQLKKEYYPLWAQYFVTFLDHIKKENVDVFAVSAQNEPAAVQTWDSCIYSPEEEGAFVLDHLGPALKASAHADTKVLIWDHNRDVIEERVTPILSDPRAKEYVWGVAFHWYVSEAFENLSHVKDTFPDTHLLFTEGCIEGGVKLGAYGSGERYMRNMIGDFANGCEGYIEWNLMLDMQGGPNHVGNYCDAPIICDVDNDHFHVNSSYHAIGHFSRHVKPGAKRIKSQLDHPFITHVAFINPSGETVVIIQNETEESTTFGISAEGEAFTFKVEPHSYSTIVF